jgi:hypothetical protein
MERLHQQNLKDMETNEKNNKGKEESELTKETKSASAGVDQTPPDDGSEYTTEVYQGMNQPDSMSSTDEDLRKMHTLIKKEERKAEDEQEGGS